MLGAGRSADAWLFIGAFRCRALYIHGLRAGFFYIGSCCHGNFNRRRLESSSSVGRSKPPVRNHGRIRHGRAWHGPMDECTAAHSCISTLQSPRVSLPACLPDGRTNLGLDSETDEKGQAGKVQGQPRRVALAGQSPHAQTATAGERQPPFAFARTLSIDHNPPPTSATPKHIHIHIHNHIHIATSTRQIPPSLPPFPSALVPATRPSPSAPPTHGHRSHPSNPATRPDRPSPPPKKGKRKKLLPQDTVAGRRRRRNWKKSPTRYYYDTKKKKRKRKRP